VLVFVLLKFVIVLIFLKEKTLAAHTGKQHLGDSSVKSGERDSIRKAGPIETGRNEDYEVYQD